MKRTMSRLLIFSSAMLVSGGLALAQQQPMGSSPGSAPMNPAATNPEMNGAQQMQQVQNSAEGSMMDKAFVESALQGGMGDVELGKLAAEKGASPDVKQFGQKMVADNTRLGDQMQQVAQQMGVHDPKGLSKKDKKLVAKLETLSGSQFDDAYIKAMVKDNKDDLSSFQEEANNTQNSTLRQVAQRNEQVIDGHLQIIEQIAKAHDVKG
jgi:putative membrane protein